MRVGIVGSGVYCDYIISCLSRNCTVEVFERGFETKLPDDDIVSFKTSGNFHYSGHKKGRRFGRGGTSAVWGGQLFRFSKVDRLFFSDENSFMGSLVDEKEEDKSFLKGFYIKSGLWRWPWRKRGNLPKREWIKYRWNTVVVKIESNQKGRGGRLFTSKNESFDFDLIFLTAGVFGNLYILGVTNFSFKDHVSLRLGTVNSAIFRSELIWNYSKFGLRTFRIISESCNIPHYVHFVFNKKTYLVEVVRKYTKGEQLTFKEIGGSLIELLFWCYSIIRSKFIPYPNSEIEVVLDIELIEGFVDFAAKELVVNVDREMLRAVFTNIQSQLVEEHLISTRNNFNYEKYEDVYHPVRAIHEESEEDYLARSRGVYRIDTGLLESSCSTNPTGVLFPLIDRILIYEQL